MEYRKELSEKSKKLIASQFKSDIHNTSTGYYKKEVIFPITPKPNELKQKIKEFIPKYKEVPPSEMRLNNLLSDQQKHNSKIMQNLKTINNKKNQELEIIRQREKLIKDNCYDTRGNFSARKRRLFEFYGVEGIEKMHSAAHSRSNSKSIKDTRKLNRSFFMNRIPKNLHIYNNDNESLKDKYSNIDDKENINNKDNIIDNKKNNCKQYLYFKKNSNPSPIKNNKNLKNHINFRSNLFSNKSITNSLPSNNKENQPLTTETDFSHLLILLLL